MQTKTPGTQEEFVEGFLFVCLWGCILILEVAKATFFTFAESFLTDFRIRMPLWRTEENEYDSDFGQNSNAVNY